MTPELWARLEEIFQHAIDLPPERREAYLSEACDGDERLEAEARALIAASVTDDGSVERVVRDATERAIADRPNEHAGRRIGRYRVISTLAHGGMGAVYLAERADGTFEQRVAIKMLGAHRMSPDLRMRFRAEQQILARLQHPNVAQLIDGGDTEDGTPYLVMEYLEGECIDVYCDRSRLGITERLEIFIRICSAVHYSHQNLIVHRDIKPSNILVTADGEPKLLDFGIAKILDTQLLTQPVAQTVEGMRLMTPEHASPEQARGERVTTASDVYSLGVLLYDLLCGLPPYTMDRRRAGDIERVICEQIPPDPSARCDEQGVAATQRAAVRRCSPQQLRRRLRGDLDNIALMALRKEPERRYMSAQQIADDLRRHIKGLPVLARPDTWTYRSSKFIRRHRAVVALSVLFVLLLAGFTARTVEQARRIGLERDTAQQVSTLLESLFVAPDPQVLQGRDMKLTDVLDAGALQVREGLAQQPELEGRLLEVIGRVYHHIGSNAEAEAVLRRSLEVRRSVLPAQHVDVAASLSQLGAVLYENGDYAAAEAAQREALDVYAAVGVGDDRRVAEALDRLGWVLILAQRLDEAEASFTDALSMYARLQGPDGPKVALVLTNLAQVAHWRGDYELAERRYRRALEIGRAVLPQSHPDMSDYLYNLAALLHARGRLEDAEMLYVEALEVTRRALPPEHPDLSIVLAGLGRLLHDQGDLVGAEVKLREALALTRRVHQSAHKDLAYNTVSLALVLQDRGELPAARAMFEEALGVYRTELSPVHAYTATALTGLGENMALSGAAPEAEPLLRDALAMWLELRGPDHWQSAVTRSTLGYTLVLLGREDDGGPMMEQAHALLIAERGPGDRRTCAAARRLVEWQAPRGGPTVDLQACI